MQGYENCTLLILHMDNSKKIKFNFNKKRYLKITAIVTIAVFLFNSVFMDLVWAYSVNQDAKNGSLLRAIPAEESWVAKAIGERLGKGEDKKNIASGNWTEEYHNELNAQIRKLIGKKGTDVTSRYPVEKQKKELNVLLKDFFASISEEEKAKWNNIISDSNLAIGDTEELFKKLAGLLDRKKTGFFYLKPPKGVFYLKRQGLPPLIAEEHFGHNRKSKTDKKEINNLYIAEPSVKLKTNEEQQGIILHGLIHLIIGAGETEHNFASKVQMRFERHLLEKEIPADFLKRYSRYYELKSEILEAEKANDNRLYQKKRAELIKTVDYLRKLAETVPDEQFKKGFELLRLNQIENQEDVNLILGSFDEFYHLSTPEYNDEEKAVLEEIAREMAQGLKKWHNPDEVYQEAMSAMKPFHIKNLLPESIDEKDELKRRFLSGQIKAGIQEFNGANHIGACFTRGLETVSVLAKGLGNKDSSVSFLKATVKHELIHYFSFKGIIPIRYEREDISTAITVIEFLEQEGMEIFNKYQDFFTPVGAELYQAGCELQKEGKVFLDEEYLLKRAFEIFEADERLSDNAIMLVRDPAGRNAEETALLTAQVNDMRQRVIGVIMAGALIQHSKESGEPLLETLIEFFKVLAEKALIPRVAEIEEAIKQAKEQGIPEKNMQELNQLLKQAKKQRAEVEKAKMNVVSWAKRATGIPGLSYVEAGGKIPQWAFLPAPHEKVVGVEEDLYRLSSRNAYYGLVVLPVFESKYGAKVREKLIEDEFKDNPYFNLLWRIMDTPRIMAFGWDGYPGTVNWVKAVYEERFKEDNLLVAQTLLSSLPRPLQYLDSFIYRWYRFKNINKDIDRDERLKNKDVLRAIENTRPAYSRITNTINPKEIYQLVKDEIWPEFKKLIDSEMAEQKEMELFKQKHQGVSPNQIQQMWNGMSDAERQAAQKQMEKQWQEMSEQERQKIIDGVERQIQEAIEEYLARSSRAQAGGERTSPSPAMPGQAGALKTSGPSQKPAEGKSEDMNRLAGQLQRMAERLKEKAENLSRQSNQAGKGTKELSKEAEDVEGNAGAADLSKDVEELAKTARETAEGFSSLKKQTEQFKNRTNSLNETAKQSSNLESANEVKQNSEKLDRTAEDMDRTAGKGKEVSQEAVGDAQQIKDIISKSGRREVNAIRQKAEALSQKADELAKYARDLAKQAGKAENQAGEVGQSASEMGMETAQKTPKDKPTGQAGDPEPFAPRTPKPTEQARGRSGTGQAEQGSEQAGESSWEMTEETRKPESLKGIDSLAQQAREKNIADAGEFDLSKYLEKEPSIPAPKEEISKQTKEQIREHEARMKKIREENFLKKEGITVEQYQSYQRAKMSVQSQIANIERELKSILIPGGGSEFLRERSYGEIDEDALAEIPAGKTKIFKQQQIPKKKKAVISLLVDISSSMGGEKLENAVLAALAFQEALKKFEISSNVDLQFEVAGYNKYAYIELKDYKDKLMLKKAFKVIYDLKTIKEGSGGTSDYQALSLAVQRMRQTKLGKDPEAKKIILNITDGNVGANAESIQKLYTENPDIRIISFGIDKNEKTARAIALSYGPRYGVAVSDISTVPKAVMRRLKLELKRPVSPNNIAATIVNNTLIFGFTSLSGLISMGTAGLIQFMKDVDFNKLPKEEPVYEGSKFLIVRENRKEFLVYRDPETEEEKIRIERGPRSNKRVPKIEWNPDFENEENMEILLDIFQMLYPTEKDNLMRNVGLIGEDGTGKDVLIKYAYKLLNQNLRSMPIHKRTDKNQLIKRRTFGKEKGSDGKYRRKTGWANSELIEAAINGDGVVLNEINKAEADNLGVLNYMLEKGVFTDKDGKTRKVHKDFRVLASANPPGGIYAVNVLSGEFLDRMAWIEVDYLKEENEIKLLQSWAPNVPKEKIEFLVQAAWNLRARYFGWTSRANMLAEDEIPAEKGTYMKRPISTAELRKIVEHFDKYPYDLENRPWSVINRHFSLANEDPLEVETMKEEIRSEFEGLGFQDKISIDDIIIQKENNQIEVKEDKATGVKTRFWKIKPDKGGDELNLKLIDEGPMDKNEEPEEIIDEVQRNLVRFYDIAKDISLGNHLLFVGHMSTGKNVIADFISYMLAGGDYLIPMNKLIEPGDLTAWQGYAELSDEEKVEWIDSFVAKAMREGKPVIIDEVNKADAGVVAVLNGLLEDNILTLPSGEVVEAAPGFCVIATMNPPISGLYEGVEPLSGEFIRRFSIHEFDYLPFEQELEILKKTGKYKVNEKYIERLLMAATKLREKYIQEGAIDRPVSTRALKRIVARVRDYGDHLPGGKKKRKDEQLFKIFEQSFPLDDRTQKEVVKGIFKESDIALLPAGRVDENTPDAIDELLDGQPLVLRGEIKIEPDTGDKAADNILKVLQLNYNAVGAGKKIEALTKLIEERISEWSETDFRRHIESALYFGEVMKVTLVIRGMAHSKDNLRALEELEQRMEKHLLAYHWPATFFTEAPEIDNALLKIISHTQDQKINEILGLLQVFFVDEDYRKDLLKNLRQDYVEAKFKDINKGQLDEFIDDVNLLSKMKRILDKIAGYVDSQEGQALKDLSKFIAKKLKESGWPTYAKASAGRPASSRKFEDENILWQRYLRVLQQSANLKNKEEIEAAKKEAEEIFKEAKEIEADRVVSLYGSDIYQEKIFELLWGVQTARAPTIEHRLEQLDKEFVNDFMKAQEWDNKDYDVYTMLKFLWIKAYLLEIVPSLNKENAYQPKECAGIIKDYINKIDEQFKTYHWPVYQRLKPFIQEFPRIGVPVKIGLTQGPIALQPAVSAEQIEKWKAELAELEKEEVSTAGQEVQYYSKEEASEWVKNNLTTVTETVKKVAIDIIQNIPKEIDISRVKIKVQRNVNTIYYDTYIWEEGQNERDIKPVQSTPKSIPRAEEKALVGGLYRLIIGAENWNGGKELVKIFSKREGGEINYIPNNFGICFEKWFEEKVSNIKSEKLTTEERAFFEKYFDRSAGVKEASERTKKIAELKEKIRQAEGQLAFAPAGEVSGREEMLRIIGEMEGKIAPSAKPQAPDSIEDLLKEWGLGEEAVGDRELRKEVELSNNRKLILKKLANHEESVELWESDGRELGNRRLWGSEQFGESGIIRIVKDKEVYIECFNDDKNEDNLYWKVSIDNLSVLNVSKEEAYGIDVRREIVRLAGEYLIKTKDRGQRTEDRKKELEKILEEIRGYFEYANSEMSAKEVWDVKALAMRVYRMVGGQLEKDKVVKLCRSLFKVITHKKENGFSIDELKNYIPAVVTIFSDNVVVNNLVGLEGDGTGHTILIELETALGLNQDNLFVSKQLIHTLKKMFMVWKNEEVEKKIIDILTKAIKPENDEGLNMEILEVLDGIWPEIILNGPILQAQGKIMTKEEYSQRLKVKTRKIQMKRLDLANFITATGRNGFRYYLDNLGKATLLDKLAWLEIAIENIDSIKDAGWYDKVEKAILDLLDDDALEVRIAAAEALVKLAGENKDKKQEFRDKIWEKWDEKEASNQISEFVSVYAWALWRLGKHGKEVSKEILERLNALPCDSCHSIDLESVVSRLCEIVQHSEDIKQDHIFTLMSLGVIDEDIFNPIRAQIFDYLAKQIDESFTQTFESIIDSIIEQLQKEDISSNLRTDFSDFLKKIYAKVGDKGKEIIRDKISSLPSEIQIVVLPDAELLPVKSEFLENEKTSAEYVERLFKILPGMIEGKREKGDGRGKKLEIDFAKIKEGRTYNSNEVIRHIDEEIKRSKESLKTESDQKKIDEINKEIGFLNELEVLIEEESKVEIEISSVNYGKACQAYFEVLKKGDETEISQTYQRVMVEIKAADSLEMVEAMQRMYLYVMQELSVTPIPFALLRYGAGGRPRTIRSAQVRGRWETRDERRGTIPEIAREITRRLEGLKKETIEKIDLALKAQPSEQNEKRLIKAKGKIQEIDFTQPLRAFKKGKRKFFKYDAEMDINRILSKGRSERFGMFILPIPLSLLGAETFKELGNRIKGFLSDAKGRAVQLFEREREDISREKIKLNQARLAEFKEKGKERVVIVHHELFRDNLTMVRVIMGIIGQCREAEMDNLKVVLALNEPKKKENFYESIKKAAKGIDLSGQFDSVVSAQEPAESVIKKIKTKYSGVERIDVLGIPAWAEKYEKLPELKDNIVVICELGDEKNIVQALGVWQVFNEFLSDEDRERLFGPGAETTGFFKYESKKVDKKFQRELKIYRKFAEFN